MNWKIGVMAAVLAFALAACSGEGAGTGAGPVPEAAVSPEPAPIPDAITAVYAAEDGAELTARFDTKKNTVEVTLPDGRTVTLPRAVSGSGARYSDGRETFWEHQGEATYTVGEETLFRGMNKNP